jgi:hypothetical protein
LFIGELQHDRAAGLSSAADGTRLDPKTPDRDSNEDPMHHERECGSAFPDDWRNGR